MPQTNHNSAASINWARSLLELANEHKQADGIGADLRAIVEVIQSNPTFGFFLADPAIGALERGGVIQRTFGKHVSPLLYNFLGVVNAHGAAPMLPQIADAYDDLLEAQVGKIEVDVTVAQKLTPDELEQVRKKVSAALKKDAVVHLYVDETILGGVVLRIQDQLIDGSVKYQLQAMKEKLLAAKAS